MEAELAREFDNEREGKRDWERLRIHMIYKWQQPKSSRHQPEQAKWFHRSNYISCSKAHRRFNYGFQWHYNDFMTENTIAHQWNLEFVTQRNGREVLGWELCEFDRCARDGCRPRRGCAAGWRRCHSARTRMSPNMAVLCFEPSVESGVFAQVVQLCQITCDFDIGMIRKWMKRVIKCAKHDEYAFYRVVGPLKQSALEVVVIENGCNTGRDGEGLACAGVEHHTTVPPLPLTNFLPGEKEVLTGSGWDQIENILSIGEYGPLCHHNAAAGQSLYRRRVVFHSREMFRSHFEDRKLQSCCRCVSSWNWQWRVHRVCRQWQ